MKNLKIIGITTIIVVGIIFIGYSILNRNSNGVGGGYTYQNCNITTTEDVVVGDDLSTTMLTATSGRTWARIQLEANETDNVYLMFGSTATVTNGLLLSSTTVKYIDIGMATDIPYSGIVTGITDGTASSTLLLTECR